ncbi:hypothetical protein [Tychonema sp. LEGE 06208]|uniref:hypothetical protein n=1 Tax=Tychonema sp. LEGE 06208 TaxID=1828663 RepID=UPI0030D73591
MRYYPGAGIGRSEAEGLGGAKRRDWAERSGGIGRSEAEGLGGAKRRDWAERSGGIGHRA